MIVLFLRTPMQSVACGKFHTCTAPKGNRPGKRHSFSGSAGHSSGEPIERTFQRKTEPGAGHGTADSIPSPSPAASVSSVTVPTEAGVEGTPRKTKTGGEVRTPAYLRDYKLD